MASESVVATLREDQLGEADRIFRLAFGTFLKLPDPAAFAGDADYVRTRWRADPKAGLAAVIDGRLVGSNFAARWGSFGFFGPLSVHPELWDRGVARKLLVATMEMFEKWQLRYAGLFTFAESTKHVALYQKFGFAPRFLTAIMSKGVQAPTRPEPPARLEPPSRYGALTAPQQEEALQRCRALTDGICEGLDLAREIRAVHEQSLGDTVLLATGNELAGFAVCHWGPGSEAGTGTLYVKFAAVRCGAGSDFERLLGACESLACEMRLQRLIAGVNTARDDAYARLRRHGYRTEIQGVAMQRPNEPAFNRPDALVIDDWR